MPAGSRARSPGSPPAALALLALGLSLVIWATAFRALGLIAQLDDNAFAGYGTVEGLAPGTIHVLWVIGFLAGFSERFALDFVDRAQGRFDNGGAKAKTTT